MTFLKVVNCARRNQKARLKQTGLYPGKVCWLEKGSWYNSLKSSGKNIKPFVSQCQANLKDRWIPGNPDILLPTLSMPLPAKVGRQTEKDQHCRNWHRTDAAKQYWQRTGRQLLRGNLWAPLLWPHTMSAAPEGTFQHTVSMQKDTCYCRLDILLGVCSCIHLLPSKKSRTARDKQKSIKAESDIGNTHLILPDLFCRIKIRGLWTIWLRYKKFSDGTIPKSNESSSYQACSQHPWRYWDGRTVIH